MMNGDGNEETSEANAWSILRSSFGIHHSSFLGGDRGPLPDCNRRLPSPLSLTLTNSDAETATVVSVVVVVNRQK